MRLAAVVPLLLLAACTAFDGAVADPIIEQAQTQPAGDDGTSTNGGPGATDTGSGSDSSGMGEVATPNPTASAPSCAQLHGGQTCGPDGKSDCCAIATQGGVKINRYMITAGRMRAFLTKTNGNVAGFVKSLPTWKLGTDGLPTDPTSANAALGPQGKKACEQGQNTGHTFWTPKTGNDFSDFDQSTLDEKALNCVPWQLAQALCAFDGGHLAAVKDLHAAFTNDGATKFPWGDEGINVKAPDPKNRLNLEFGFGTDTVPANFRALDGHPSEVSYFIAPPGSFPAGDNKSGVADAAGNLLEWVGDSPRQFVWKGDFEHHASDAATMNVLSGGGIWMDKQASAAGIPLGGSWVWGNSQLAGNAGTADQKDGYYAIGGRCAF